jgi:hypothetical protein
MMTTIRKLAVLAPVAVLLFMADVPPEPSRVPLGIKLISDAHAIFGVRRRTRRRSLAFGYMAGSEAAHAADASSASASSASQQPAQSAAAPPPKPAATVPPPKPAATGGALALGTVVSALPAGCAQTAAGGVEYYHCGANYYRAVFQGNNLVYVTAKP